MKSPMRLAFSLVAAICAMFVLTATASAAPPDNDNFDQAAPVLAGVQATGNNNESTIESGEAGIRPAWGLYNSVWFSFTPTADGVVSFNACTTFTSNMVVVVGSTLATASLAHTGPDSAGQSSGAVCESGAGNQNNNVLGIAVTKNVTVRIHLGSAFSGTTGSYKLNTYFTPNMTNDDFEDASDLQLGSTVTGANEDYYSQATEQVGEPQGLFGSNAHRGVWYRLTTSGTGDLSLNACSLGGFHGLVDIFTGSSLDALTPYNLLDASPCQTYNEYLSKPTTLYIRVSGYAAATGSFTLLASFNSAAENDNFAAASVLSGTSASADWSNEHAGMEADETINIGTTGTLWYKWTAPADGWIDVAACKNDMDTELAIFTGSALATLDQQTGSNDGCGLYGARISAFAVTSGTTYYVQVAGYNVTGESNIELDYYVEPTNDNVADATDLGSASAVHTFADNRLASEDSVVGEPTLKGNPHPKSVWYKWTAPVTTTATFSNCSETWQNDAILGVFQSSGDPDDPAPGDLEPVPGTEGDGDDNCGTGGLGKMDVPVVAGRTYWIVVANYSFGHPGQKIHLDITHAPVNTAAPVISGANRLVGTQLSVTAGAWAGEEPLTYTYAWQRCGAGGGDCDSIDDADGSTYTLVGDDEGFEIRVRIVAEDANGSGVAVSGRTAVIDIDTDNDGIGDDSDSCPATANGPGKTSGCPLENVNITGSPSVTGNAQVGSSLTLDIGSAANAPGNDPTVGAPTSEIHWYSCSSATIVVSCATRSGSGTTYSPTSDDVGRFIRAEVVWSNDDADSSLYSAATAAVVAAPVVNPPGGGGSTPPAPTDPLTLTLKKSLGTIKTKNGAFSVAGNVVSCANSATGACTGQILVTYKKVSYSTRISVAPGKSSAVAFKPGAGLTKQLKKSKKLKITIKITVSAPGFPTTTASSKATLKYKK